MRFTAIIVGCSRSGVEHAEGDSLNWPEPVQREEWPMLVRLGDDEETIGYAVAAFPPECAKALRCADFDFDGGVIVSADDIEEHYDHEAGIARDAWQSYRAQCKQAGFDPEEGSLILATGNVEAGE